MSETLLIALVSLIGNLAGSAASIIVAYKLIAYRVEKLEEQAAKFDGLDTRVHELEKINALQNEKIENTNDTVHEIKNRLERIAERIPTNA